MDSLIKELELGARYAWPFFAVSIFVLLMPESLADKLDLLALRRTNAGYLWLFVLFTGAVAIGGTLPTIRSFLWRYAICPFRKLALPVVDYRTKVTQSRFRYYRVQFTYGNGDKPIFYHAINSNGTAGGFFNEDGKRVLPVEPNDGHIRLDGGTFHQPNWGKIDWSDIFNGQGSSGMWGITER